MMRLPAFLRTHAPALVLACATALPVTRFAVAQDAAKPADTAAPAPAPAPTTDKPADAAAPAPAPAAQAAPGDTAAAQNVAPKKLDENLVKSVDDFWHYGKIGRYDLANDAGKKVLAAGAQPVDVLAAFQEVTRDRGDDITSMLLRWQEVDALKDTSAQLLKLVTEGRNQHRTDVAFIRKQIERLSVNQRGYMNGLESLRQSGEIAVPFMVEYLRDNSKREYHAAIRQALVDLGRSVLNPLLACTEMKNDNETLISLVNVLGQIGYNDEIPYLARLASDKNVAPAVQSAAAHALEHMGAGDPKSLNVAGLFQDLGEKFYYGQTGITYDRRNPVAYVWFYDDQKGLYKEDVTPTVWGDLMTMRACEYSLKADASKPEAVSLWLAADYRRESDLGADGIDPINKGKPAASFYGTQAGVSYLNAVLDRAMRDHTSAVALKAIQSLEGIAGQSSLYSGDVKPLTDAMAYPDRLVRFEAAIAAGSALPTKQFNGQERVVPILGEAIAQTGKTNALLLTGNQDAYNKLAEQLKTAGYGTAGGTNPEQAIAAAQQIPSVDVIVIDTTSGIDQQTAEHMLTLAGSNPRLAQLARVFVGATERANPFSALSIGNPLVTVTTATTGDQLKPILQKARERSGSLPLDEKTASAYSLRAAQVLQKLAVSRTDVLHLTDAQATLLGALDDQRAEVAKECAAVLGVIDSKDAQGALLNKAADAKTADDLKVAFLKAGASNARFFGNRVNNDQVATLRKLADSSQSAEVKGAAAEFLGALNLPSDEAKSLIVKQSRVS